MATKHPIFPANRVQLTALSTVLEITCCESKATYESVKATRPSPAVSEAAGEPYRRCSKDTLFEVMGGECKDLFANLVGCNQRNEYNYATKCKSIRNALEKCAVKNKTGELGQSY